MQVDVRWNVSNLSSVDGDLVCKHARCGDLDGVWPVVVVVAQGICEVEDRFLGDVRIVLCDIEVSGLHGTLGHGVWHEEEVEFAVDDLCLLNESLIDEGSLRRVEDLGARLLEEPLSDSLVDDDEGDVWELLLFTVLISHDLLQLLELVRDDLLSHGIADTISVDENVFRQLSTVEFLVGCKCSTIVLLQDV